MTTSADLIRDRRRTFAAPGGAHDRLVSVLARALPAGVGLMIAVMVLAPLSQRSEISFLLDRNAVAVVNERMRVDRATYRGTDDHGRDFTVTAGNAVQTSAMVPIVRLEDLVASLTLNDGPARMTARRGDYNFQTDRVNVNGLVEITALDGYRMTTDDVAVDLKRGQVLGTDRVNGTVPTGTFSADQLLADLESRTVTLQGNARLRMTPGKLRIPQ